MLSDHDGEEHEGRRRSVDSSSSSKDNGENIDEQRRVNSIDEATSSAQGIDGESDDDDTPVSERERYLLQQAKERAELLMVFKIFFKLFFNFERSFVQQV